jgi:hypothetical protein
MNNPKSFSDGADLCVFVLVRCGVALIVLLNTAAEVNLKQRNLCNGNSLRLYLDIFFFQCCHK